MGIPLAIVVINDHDVEHDWRSWQRVGLIILRSWVRSPHCALREFETNFQIMNGSVMSAVSTIGAAGSASVLCTGGPGFDPLIVHPITARCINDHVALV